MQSMILFAERLRSLRRGLDLTQIQLAQKIGVSKQAVSNWENDNILPSVEMVARTADFFQVSTDYLLGRESAPHQDGTFLEVTGLTQVQIKHVEDIINDIRNQ